jgi:hypothetical protein
LLVQRFQPGRAYHPRQTPAVQKTPELLYKPRSNRAKSPAPTDNPLIRMQTPLTRRAFIVSLIATAATASLPVGGFAGVRSPPDRRYKIGGCDWIMLKRQKLGGV